MSWRLSMVMKIRIETCLVLSKLFLAAVCVRLRTPGLGLPLKLYRPLRLRKCVQCKRFTHKYFIAQNSRFKRNPLRHSYRGASPELRFRRRRRRSSSASPPPLSLLASPCSYRHASMLYFLFGFVIGTLAVDVQDPRAFEVTAHGFRH